MDVNDLANATYESLVGRYAPREPVVPPGGGPAQPPTVDEPVEPHEPWPPRPDQAAPSFRSATGVDTGAPPEARAQQEAWLTTSTGARLRDTDHSLKAGERGPTLLQDHHLREKITHFDHERIPERVVHARGAGAHGVFVGYGTADSVCRAAFLGEGVETPVFVRFSTVLGSRGSADVVRDTRGFATKFYTHEGNFDLVGNNMPVFFIQDGIKFPDIIHAGKPHPDREIPQAASAHDTFWDFVSLHTEAQHHTMWNMSDRGIPRSYRMMEGFGVHTFRVENADGATSLVKFHWKPRAGVHSVTWEEAQMINGVDPDFHRRDLYDAIEAGALPAYELGLQVLPDVDEQTFDGIDLLDPTKIVPEEAAPVQPIGLMVLTGTPTNFFAEVEQVAFHVGHLVPGIDVTDDPLVQARLFSYVDTQITRLGGPNFNQIPVNRPHTETNDMLRDGFHQHAVHSGLAPYRPNSLDGGCPFHAGADTEGAFEHLATRVAEGSKVRAQPASFDDHFSQARLFWLSMTPVEQEHIIGAYSFELAKCTEDAVRQRQLECLAQIDARLCAEVAAGLGMPVPQDAPAPPAVEPSPALSQVGRSWPVDGRTVAVVVGDPGDAAGVAEVCETLVGRGVTPLVVAAQGGMIGDWKVARTFAAARSVEFDAVVLAGAPAAAADAQVPRDAKAGAPGAGAVDPRVSLLVGEAFRHAKPIGAWGSATTVLEDAGWADAAGVVSGSSGTEVLEAVLGHLARHRVWERFPA